MNLLDIVKIIYNWRKAIITMLLIALAASSVVALLLPDYFKSVNTFYVSNPAINDRQMVFREQSNGAVTDYFGVEQDVDRALAIAKSSPVTEYMIRKYNLGMHYKIDSTRKYNKTKVREEFKDNSNIIRTELGAVQVTIWDTDNKLAAQMANDIARVTDSTMKAYFSVTNHKILTMLEKKAIDKQKDIVELSDSLVKLKPLNRADTSEQYSTLKSLKRAAVSDLNKLEQLKEQYQGSLQNDYSTINVIEKAYPDEKKDKPIRWMIVVATLLCTFVFAVIFLIVIDKYEKVKHLIIGK